MAQWDDATLMAYADGELDAGTRAAIAAAVARDPEVATRVAAHASLREQLRQAYAPVLDEPVPDRLLAMLDAAKAEPATSLNAWRTQRVRAATARWSWPEWTAMAASVAIGIFSVLLFRPQDPVVARDGTLVAQGDLAEALSEQLASTQSETAAVQVGISFRNRGGNYCRTFQLGTTAGLACRAEEDWQVEALSAVPAPAPAGTYRTAAVSLPPALRAAVEAAIDGDAFDAEAESAALQGGWKVSD